MLDHRDVVMLTPIDTLDRFEAFNMAPPVEVFPASELSQRVNTLPNGRRRKGKPIDLSTCELLEMVQYSCGLKGEKVSRQAVIQCHPVVKLFRR